MIKRIAIFAARAALMFGLVTAVQAEVKAINGAGSTFAYPIFAKWAAAYHKATGIRLNYQSIGSGGGIKQIKKKTVDFGASDAPMKPEELDKHGLVQWPQIMGGVVPVVNLPGVGGGEIRFDGETLADIFLGRIRKWNDPRIAALNPGVALPDRKITVVHRSDGSGTTFIFTSYLSKVSPAWKEKVGAAKAVSWPTGVGAAGAEWDKVKHYYLILTDQPGEQAWPITGATFVIVHATAEKPERTAAVLRFFDWAFHHGREMADELHYVPMPEQVVKMIEKTWAAKIRSADGAPVWTPEGD